MTTALRRATTPKAPIANRTADATSKRLRPALIAALALTLPLWGRADQRAPVWKGERVGWPPRTDRVLCAGSRLPRGPARTDATPARHAARARLYGQDVRGPRLDAR